MDNIKKEQIAKSTVKNLFEEAGFKVFRYSFEHLLPELAGEKSLRGPVAQFIKQQPDFVVLNKENEAFFIKVKFESNCVLEKDAFNYPDCYIVLLTKEGVLAQSTKYVQHKGWKFDCLNKFHPFKEISSELLKKYSGTANKKFDDKLWTALEYQEFVKKKTGKKPSSSPSNAIEEIKPSPTVKFVIVEKTEEEKLEIARGIVKPGKKIRRPHRDRSKSSHWSRSHKRKSFGGDRKGSKPSNSTGRNSSFKSKQFNSNKDNSKFKGNKGNSKSDNKRNFNKNKDAGKTGNNTSTKNKFGKSGFKPRSQFKKKRFNSKPNSPHHSQPTR